MGVPDAKKRKGLIIVHTGDGKGKTTAAMGTALRACGHEMRVGMVQFIKGAWKPGEYRSAPRLGTFEILPMGEGFTWQTQDRDRDTVIAGRAWETCKEKARSGDYDLVIWDEILYAIDYGLLDESEVVGFLKQKPRDLHVILTGRNAGAEMIEVADLVTEMREIKHPFHEGGEAVKGIDF